MARIDYKQGCEPLSGTYCGVMYKTYADGRSFAYIQPIPSEKEAKKNPAARADRIIKLCVIEIQKQMHNKPEAMKQYTNIVHRVQRLYEKGCALEEDNIKLETMILTSYWQSRRVLPSRKREATQLTL